MEPTKRYMSETGEKPIYRNRNGADFHTLKYVRWLETELARMNRLHSQSLACIQILAKGEEPNILSEFPAAEDVRALYKEYRDCKDEEEGMKKQRKVIGKCGYCKDPIYDFQKKVDGMHKGCSKIREREKKGE